MKYHFRKMNGLGNDFVIFDQREVNFDLTPERIQAIAHRRFGIGCDQLIILENPKNFPADVFMRIFNADGHEVGACGNATRCLGSLLAEEFKRNQITIETIEGLLQAQRLDNDTIQVNMGAPRLDWQAIPLAKATDTLHLPIKLGVLNDPVAVSMGNPHMVFFVKDAAAIDLYTLGKELTQHPLYPEQANVEIVEVLDRHTLRVRVYERGTGITMACGTGASASVVAAVRRGLTEPQVTVVLDGGSLDITYQDSVMITGPVGYAFDGSFDERLFKQYQDKCTSQTNPSQPWRLSPLAVA
jgi:diaminopimelate epimerase